MLTTDTGHKSLGQVTGALGSARGPGLSNVGLRLNPLLLQTTFKKALTTDAFLKISLLALEKYQGNQGWKGCDHGGRGTATGEPGPGSLLSLKASTYTQRLKSGDPKQAFCQPMGLKRQKSASVRRRKPLPQSREGG